MRDEEDEELYVFCCKAKTRTQLTEDVKEEMVNEFPKDAGGAEKIHQNLIELMPQFISNLISTQK